VTVDQEQAHQDLVDAIIIELERKQVVLPTLPEIALRIRSAVEDENIDAIKLAKIINADASIAGRLVQAANSAMFAGMVQTSSVQSAIGRLGFVCVRNIALSLSMSRLYDFKHDSKVYRAVKQVWKHSVKVAAVCQILAKHKTNLEPSEAMLAGLIHNIGALPVITRCADHPEFENNPDLLWNIVTLVEAQLGHWILQQWHFVDQIAEVPLNYRNLGRSHAGKADYSDVVTVANLIAQLPEPVNSLPAEWQSLPAYQKLDLDNEQCLELLETAGEEIRNLTLVLS
jgi:HD-like signal output (HDOD) protein